MYILDLEAEVLKRVQRLGAFVRRLVLGRDVQDPGASMSMTTSIRGTPRGAGLTPDGSNFPNKLQ